MLVFDSKKIVIVENVIGIKSHGSNCFVSTFTPKLLNICEAGTHKFKWVRGSWSRSNFPDREENSEQPSEISFRFFGSDRIWSDQIHLLTNFFLDFVKVFPILTGTNDRVTRKQFETLDKRSRVAVEQFSFSHTFSYFLWNQKTINDLS